MRPIKNFQKYFMAHQYMPKKFPDPCKNPPPPPPPPSRILNVRSLNKNINWKTNLTLLLTVKKKHSNKSVNSLFTIVFYHRFFPQLYPLPHLIFNLLRRNTLMHPTRCLVQIWPLWPLETNPAMYRVNSDKVM